MEETPKWRKPGWPLIRDLQANSTGMTWDLLRKTGAPGPTLGSSHMNLTSPTHIPHSGSVRKREEKEGHFRRERAFRKKNGLRVRTGVETRRSCPRMWDGAGMWKWPMVLPGNTGAEKASQSGT